MKSSELMEADEVAHVLRRLGKGAKFGDLDARARLLLKQLERKTGQFWGASETAATYTQQLLTTKCHLLPLIYPAFKARCRQLRLNPPPLATLWRIYLPLAQWLVMQREKNPKETFVLGVSGAQGSGKSTLCGLLQIILEAGFDQRTAILSIDDFYLSQTERRRLADQVHPLFRTRGVPGTHDISLAMEILTSLKEVNQSTVTSLPVFDKATDNPLPREKWIAFQGKPAIILFEGWCVGARPEPEPRLVKPMNTLEAEEDREGTWRHYVNRMLENEYAQLFGLLNALLFLEIPTFEVVYRQRLEQEQQLAQLLQQRQGSKEDRRTMSPSELRHFIMHFQRLTEYLLDEMPGRADLVLKIDDYRRFQSVKIRSRT
ncbi:kinase [Nitrosococcus watsonii]|uniref:Kinase-like protein n=1 Tax=Nitrosococcus watsoni (strain C-113) TaxID=105559 RepID=D8KA24_NITWC|nr:kinase [Nitrosococcus watsonii]ADJ29382.1 kinase-like protein [Nitrosococcus watsonii C-113]